VGWVEPEHDIEVDDGDLAGSRTELDPRLLSEMWVEVLERKGRMWGEVYSGSMRPLIRVQDRVLVCQVELERVRVGDIVLFWSGRQLVAHRVLLRWRNRGAWVLLQKGDFNLGAAIVQADSVLGRVEAVKRDDRVVDLLAGGSRWVQVALALYGLGLLSLRLVLRLLSHLPGLNDLEQRLMGEWVHLLPNLWVKRLLYKQAGYANHGDQGA